MIVFYDDYPGIGGGENLIIRVCSHFYKIYGMRLKVICPAESYLFQRLEMLGIDFQHIDSNLPDLSNTVDGEDILIRTDFGSMTKFKNCQSRFLYWEILPTVFANSIHPAHSFFKQRLIDYLWSNQALYFMDKNGVEELRRRKYTLSSCPYIPIPVEESAHPITSRVRKYGHYHFTYIGRDVDWKIYPLKKVIDDCSALSQYHFTITIFCDTTGNYRRILTNTDSNITLHYREQVFGEDLDRQLLNFSDLHFAMGTAALEGARLGLPTILLDYSTTAFPADYQYKFLYQAQGFSLGDHVQNSSQFSDGRNLTELLSIINSPEEYEGQSEACRTYVTAHHSIEHIGVTLLNACKHSSAKTYNVYRKLAQLYYGVKVRSWIKKQD